MFMRDDELYNAAIGVFYDAPTWKHEDYYAFMLLERMLGQYQLDKNGVAHLNDIGKQYSMFEGYCGNLPDLQRAQGMYSPYSDCGLFGSYFHGNDCWTRIMTYTGIFIPASYGKFVNQVEVYRARARLYHELLNIQSPADVLQFIGPQIQYLGRRIHRSEIAKRISYFDDNSIKKVAREWLFDAEPSIVGYGPVEMLSSMGSYKYFKINSYVTTANLSHSLNC
jgi:mitochondrial-processing peptidase subunit beta